MNIRQTVETAAFRWGTLDDVEGNACFDKKAVMELFYKAPYDLLPQFEGPKGSRLRGGRGKDHPRYGRFIYAFGKVLAPTRVVEVGTYAGGTAIGWGKALMENGRGQLICVDNDTYSKNTYPATTQRNLDAVGVSRERVDFRNGDSKNLIPALAQEFPKGVDIYLVDGDHTYEGALLDMTNGLPMMKSGSYMLVHDIDRHRRMDEMTPEHPYPVYEAFQKVVKDQGFDWCILKFIRKHLGVIRIS